MRSDSGEAGIRGWGSFVKLQIARTILLAAWGLQLSNPVVGSEANVQPNDSFADVLTTIGEYHGAKALSGGLTAFLADWPKSDDFKRFKASVPQIRLGDKDWYIIETDIPATEDELEAWYTAHALDQPATATIGISDSQTSEMARWIKSEAQLQPQDKFKSVLERLVERTQLIIDGKPGPNGSTLVSTWQTTITYCILRRNISVTSYSTIQHALTEACNDWEMTCNVKFEHWVELDDCKTADEARTRGAKFCVQYVPTQVQAYVAYSFYPYMPPERRILYVYPSLFKTSWNRKGVFRHELGHILGFRHEKLVGQPAKDCATSRENYQNTIRLVPEEDLESVMVIPCSGIGNGEFTISDRDRIGAQKTYPFRVLP